MGARGHVVIAVLVGLLIPLSSRMAGTGSLAYTMFSRSETYRLQVVTSDLAGRSSPLAPTAISASIGGSTGDLLAGTEQWRHAPYGALLRRHLSEVAGLACGLRPDAVKATATLERIATPGSAIEVTETSRRCR